MHECVLLGVGEHLDIPFLLKGKVLTRNQKAKCQGKVKPQAFSLWDVRYLTSLEYIITVGVCEIIVLFIVSHYC
jgi:hypothetical protein